MSLKTVNTVLAALGALFILYVGVSYVFIPESTAPNFGLPSWPQGDGDGFLVLKGIRDIVSGLILLVLLVTRQRRALGWVLLVAACTPIGDMINILVHNGSTSAAIGIHGATAAVVLATGLLVLRETRNPASGKYLADELAAVRSTDQERLPSR